MFSRTVTVGSAVGLHARPAARIAQAAAGFDDEVFLELLDDPGAGLTEAASALMIMALGAEHGDQVRVSSEDETAMRRIAELVATDLDA